MSRSLAVLAAATALAACASGPPGPRIPSDDRIGAAYRPTVFLSGASLLLVQFDTNRDYATSRAEAEAGAQAEWVHAAQGAPVLTPIMFESWAATVLGGPNIGPHRLAFDTNVNNEITQAEFVAAILAKFDKYDANKDARVTRQEMTERLPEPAHGDLGGDRRGPEGGDGPQGGGRPPRR